MTPQLFNLIIFLPSITAQILNTTIYSYTSIATSDGFPTSTSGNCPIAPFPLCYFKSFFQGRQCYLPETNTFYIYHPTHDECPVNGYLYTMSFGSPQKGLKANLLYYQFQTHGKESI